MLTASVLFFIVRTIFQSPWLCRQLSTTYKYLVWNIYVSILGLVSISRIYFACHFFHQCVFGICFGVGISQFLQNRRVNRSLTEWRRKKALLLGFGVLILSISIYYSHFIISHDPHWAVRKVILFQKKTCKHFKHFKCQLLFNLELGIQLVQRSIPNNTRNNTNLFVS